MAMNEQLMEEIIDIVSSENALLIGISRIPNEDIDKIEQYKEALDKRYQQIKDLNLSIEYEKIFEILGIKSSDLITDASKLKVGELFYTIYDSPNSPHLIRYIFLDNVTEIDFFNRTILTVEKDIDKNIVKQFDDQKFANFELTDICPEEIKSTFNEFGNRAGRWKDTKCYLKIR